MADSFPERWAEAAKRPEATHALVALLFAVLGGLSVIPLGATAPSVAAYETVDTHLHLWGFWRAAYDLLGQDVSYLTSNLLVYPTHTPELMALFDPLLMLLGAPLVLAGGSPTLAFNATLGMGLAVTGFTGYLLATTQVTRPRYAVVAGVVCAFNPFVFHHVTEGFSEYAWWGLIPLALLTYRRALKRPTPRALAVHAVAVLVLFLMSIYCAGYFCIVAALWLAVDLARFARRRDAATKRRLRRVALVHGVAVVTLLPLFAMWYVTLSDLEFRGMPLGHAMPTPAIQDSAWLADYPHEHARTVQTSLDLAEWFAVATDPQDRSDGVVALAWLPVALFAALAFLSRAGRRSALGWAGLGLAFGVIALGPFLYWDDHVVSAVSLPFAWLYRWLPGFSRLAVPIRAFLVASLALAMLSTRGMEMAGNWLEVRTGDLAHRVVPLGAVFLALVAFHLFGGLRLPYPRNNASVPQVYEQIAAEEGAFAVLELPSRGGLAQRMYWQTYHGRPIYRGLLPGKFVLTYPDRTVIDNELVQALQQAFPPSEPTRLPSGSPRDLSALGFRFLVLHADGYEEGEAYGFAVDQAELTLGTPLYRGDDLSCWRLPDVPMP